MDAFDLRKRLVDDYRRYTRSFIRIRDARIREFVDDILAAEGFWPEPLLPVLYSIIVVSRWSVVPADWTSTVGRWTRSATVDVTRS